MTVDAKSPPDLDNGSARLDPQEVARFEAMAAQWWDRDGPMAALHAMQAVRLRLLVDQIRGQFGISAQGALRGLRILDVGCGAGLICEPLARLGAEVTGIDAAKASIEAARAHAQAGGLSITYRDLLLDDLLEEGARFDVVLCLEVIEHVPDPQMLVRSLVQALRPEGLLAMSTVNRTLKSWLLGIVGAEYVMGWLPMGTHEWRRFVKPEDLATMMAEAGALPVDRQGLVYDPLTRRWSRSPDDLSMNYMMFAEGSDLSGQESAS
ncbi:MAG: bifunctional 2-polyprenyl-6-hydroxyphenol methylase/3-demethylubiquinol 3-O-methyltransferase UbiG [Neomegalonema sp.]|nr:bifunctional 2-polyprenyl-6-hydroxyphenol methylase/3-demethylubiquinol 3-O-methyltransferase UbiG [Neomegalonema sp.]